MRGLRLLVTAGAVTALLAGVAAADDAADIKEAADKVLAAYNAGDVDEIMKYIVPGSPAFGGDGRMLYSVTTERMQGEFDAGTDFDLEWRDLQVSVHGSAAVSTALMGGSIILPDSTTLWGPWRNSATWAKTDGKWMVVHYHVSQVIPDDRGAQAVITRYHQAISDRDGETARACLGDSYVRAIRGTEGLRNDPSRWFGGYSDSDAIAELFTGTEGTYTNTVTFLHTSVNEHSGIVVTSETGTSSNPQGSGGWTDVENMWWVAMIDGDWKIVGSIHNIHE